MPGPPIISAIPASYKGILFRSRTEARWAVFLDELGIEWMFEPEGYKLPSGWYLPDFWMPSMNAFLEVKPSQEEWNDPRFEQIVELLNVKHFVTQGPPGMVGEYDFDDEKGMAFRWPDIEGDRVVYGGYDQFYFFCQCLFCKAWGIEFDGRSDRINCCKRNTEPYKRYTCHHANHAARKASEYRFW